MGEKTTKTIWAIIYVLITIIGVFLSLYTLRYYYNNSFVRLDSTDKFLLAPIMFPVCAITGPGAAGIVILLTAVVREAFS